MRSPTCSSMRGVHAGEPKELLGYNGSNFASNLFQQVCQLPNINTLYGSF